MNMSDRERRRRLARFKARRLNFRPSILPLERRQLLATNPIEIGDLVWNDRNANGIQDSGEPGISGVTLRLVDSSSNVVGVTGTDANGHYLFIAAPGTYTVTVDSTSAALTGFVPTSVNVAGGTAQNDSNPSPGGTSPAALPAGGSDLTVDFGFVGQSSIGGKAYTDMTANGLSADDTGLSGITVNLYTGTIATGTPITTTTGAGGAYSFPHVGPGTYTVTQATPGGWTQTVGNAGYTVSLGNAQGVTGKDFADFQNASISGTVFNDVTGDGFSTDDTPLANVLVNLYRGASPAGDLIRASLTSSASGVAGTYSFEGLAPGTYFVQAVLPSGWTFTGGGSGHLVTVGSGGVQSGGTSGGNDFDTTGSNGGSLQGSAFLQGVAFVDGNGNSALDPSDSRLPGATVSLFAADGTTLLGQTTSGPDGVYRFDNSNVTSGTLLPGTYWITETPPAGYANTGTQALSQVNPVLTKAFDRFKVQLVDPSTLWGTVAPGPGVSFETSMYGQNHGGAAGAMWATTLGDPTAGSTVSQFSTLFTDVRDVLVLNHGYGVTPKPQFGLQHNGGRIAYLYNHYALNPDGTPATLTLAQAAGLQAAVWELEFDADTEVPYAPADDLHRGDFGIWDTSDPTALTYAAQYLNASLGQSELLAFLDAVPGFPGVAVGQGILAASSLNFANAVGPQFQTVTVSGKVYDDLNADGSTAGDPGLAGVTVKLFGSAGTIPVATTTTASDGSYSFSNLGPGTYTVTQVVPAGWTQTLGAAGYSVTAVSGQDVGGKDFADFHNASVAGTVFKDLTADGFSADDAPLAGVIINISLHAGASASGPLVATAVTSAAAGSVGTYHFDDLAPGTYFVQAALPSGWTLTGGAGGHVIVVGGAGVQSGATGGGNDFDATARYAGFLQGVSFLDVNGNGLLDAVDPRLAGATVKLFASDGTTLLGQTVSGSDGGYRFDGSNVFSGALLPGTYWVTETPPAGYVNTGTQALSQVNPVLTTAFDRFKVQLVDPSTLWSTVAYGSAGSFLTSLFGQNYGGVWAGMWGATLGDPTAGSTVSQFSTFFADIPDDPYFNHGYGVTPEAQSGLRHNGGRIAYLYNHYALNPDGTPATLTLAQAAGLQAAIWELEFDADTEVPYAPADDLHRGDFGIWYSPDPTALTYAAQYLNDSLGQSELLAFLDAVPGFPGVAVGQGILAASSLNFANAVGPQFQTVTVAGKVYNDLNADGSTAGDPGLAGVTVKLFTASNPTPIATTTTASDGSYSFPNLGPGVYTVTQVVPSGWTQTLGAAGYSVTAVSGQDVSGKDFADFHNASVAGTAFGDVTGDGFSADDAPLAGLTVKLYAGTSAGGALLATAVTSSTAGSVGTYHFDDLAPGTYFVQAIPAPGSVLTGGVGGHVITVGAGGVQSGATGGGNDFDAMVANGAFLQGTAYIDLNANGRLDTSEPYLSGATVTLYASDGSTRIAQTTTDANGYYRFDHNNIPSGNLQPGTYRVVETPAPGVVNTGAQVLSPLNPATVLAANTIQVTVVDPTDLYLTYDASLAGEDLTIQANGSPELTFAGQLGVTLKSGGTTLAQFLSNCVDLFHNVGPGDTFHVLPREIGPAMGPNGGRMGYLYNHYGQSASLTSSQAAGLQVALWELQIDTTVDLASGSFSANGVSPSVLAAANAYLAESVGRSETALYLDATLVGQSVPTSGRQGMVANSSLNFSNIALASVSGSAYNDANNDGHRQASEPGVAGTQVALTGTDLWGRTVNATTTTAADGSYVFAHLYPGTYAVLETPPAGTIDGQITAGTAGGTVGPWAITGITLASATRATGYDFGYDRAPTFASAPIDTVVVNHSYVYLAQGTDPDQDTLTFSLLAGPSGMSVTSSGQVTWNPSSSTTPSDVGTHTVRLLVSDGRGGTAEQDYTIAVVAQALPNRPPVFTSTPVVDAYVGVTYSYHATATDDDGDPLTFAILSAPSGMTMPDAGPTNPAAPDPTAGVTAWTPAANQIGLNTVKLTVSDGRGGTAEQDFQILVHSTPGNHAPVIVTNPVTTSSPPAVYHYQVHAIDRDNDTLTYSLLANPSGMAINSQTGLITWSNPDNQIHEVTVRVIDGRGGEDRQTYDITPLGETVVKSVGNSSSQNVEFSPLDTYDNGTLLATAESGTFPNPFVPAAVGDYGTYTPPINGTNPIFNSVPAGPNGRSGFYRVTFNLDGPLNSPWLVVTANTDDHGAVFINGHLLHDNLGREWVFDEYAGNSVTENNPGWLVQGQNTLLFVVNNNGGGPTGLSFQADVLQGNEGLPPEINSTPPMSATVNEPFEYLVRVHDPAGEALTFTLQPKTPGGIVPTGVSIDPTSGMVTWTPTADQVGTQAFTVVATNAGGLSASHDVTVQVGPEGANSSPILLNRPGFTGVGAGVPFIFNALGYDADGDPVRYSLPIAPEGMVIDPVTGNLRWTPTADQAGNQQFLIVLQDGRGGSSPYMFSVLIPGVNRNPIFTSSPTGHATVNETYVYQVVASDPDNDPLTFTLDPSTPSGVAFDPAHPGRLIWTPTQAGSISVTINASDGRGGSATQTVTLTAVVDTTDHPPSIDSNFRTSVQVGRTYLYQVIASDPDGDPVTLSLIGAPAGMTISPGGLVSWTPTTAQLGSHSFQVQANDGRGGIDTQPVTIDVVLQQVNHDPVITATPPLAAVVGYTYYYQLTGTDADHDPLLWSLTAAPDGMVIDPQSGVLAWTPTASALGPHSVTVRVDDGQGGSAVLPFTLTVVGAAEPPQISSKPVTQATQGVAYTYQVVAYSPVGLPLTYSLSPDSAPGMTINAHTGLIQLSNPNADLFGSEQQVEVKVEDSLGAAALQTYTLYVVHSAPNQPPAIDSNPGLKGRVGKTYEYTLAATDPDGDTVTYTLGAGAPSWLSFTSPGVLSGTPSATGNDTVTVVANDGHGNMAYQTFTIAVTTNHTPTISSTAVTSATAGGTYLYAVVASDADNDALTYSLTYTLPNGVTSGTPGPAIDPQGRVTWHPGAALAGTTWPVTVTVTDPYGASFSQPYNLAVQGDTTPPSVTVQLSTDQVNVGQWVTVTVYATDNVAVASLSLTDNGQPVTLDAHGRATVVLNSAGTVTFVGSATDASGNVGTSPTAVVAVIDPNVTDVPTAAISSLASTLKATNANDTTTHLPIFAPVTIAPGHSASSDITVNDPATVLSLASALNLLDPSNANLTATLTGPNGHTVTLFSGLTGANLTGTAFDDAAATAIGSGSAPYTGTFRPTQALSALAGAAASGTYTLTVTNNSTTNTATLLGWSLTYRKATTAEVTAPVQIVGTATDAQQLSSWTLTVAPAGSPDVTTLGYGTSSVVAGVLGTFDPTMLPNGPYTLELTVTNTGGRTTIVDQDVTVTGSLKLGNLHLSFTDLTIPVAGIPITITRTYDTLNAHTKGDFGYGWTLDEGNVQVRVTQPDGTSDPRAPFQAGTRVTLTTPGGQPESFTFVPQPQVTGYFATQYYTPTFVPDLGVSDRLTVPAVTLIDNGDGTYSGIDDPELSFYTPADPSYGGSYTLTTRQGLTYVLDASTGELLTESDRNGNTLTFTDTGIFSDTGRAVTFTRDPQTNLITAITDPRGNSLVYDYDDLGNLTSATDRNGNTTQFVYTPNVPHYLDHVIDAQGRTAAQVAYGAGGRVRGLTDALGNVTSLDYDLGSLSGSVTAPGNTGATVVTYDGQGNVSSAVDPLGNATRATYSGNNVMSQTQVVNGIMLTTTYVYDNYGDVMAKANPLGNATYATYNTDGLPATITGSLGETTTLRYDGQGNLLAITGPGGIATTAAYDIRGNVLSTSTVGGTMSSGYDTYGDVASTTDVHGTITTDTNDANGNPTGSQWTWVSGSTQLVLTTINVYNANDQLIQATAADGTVTETAYDTLGRVVWAVPPHLAGQPADGSHTIYDAAGRVVSTEQYHNVVITIQGAGSPTPTSVLTSHDPLAYSVTNTTYDSQGRVEWTDDDHIPGQPCDGSRTLYDADGHVTETRRYANVVITFSSLISTLASHGALMSANSTSYDAAGNVASTTSSTGAVTTYVYDAAGQQTEVQTTADGVTAVTTTTYDAAGRVVSSTDALDHTTYYRYDGDGRLVKTIFPDGNTATTLYDTNGRKTTSIDQNGRETHYRYDAHGHLSAVLLPAVLNPGTDQSTQPTYVYDYDAYGNLTSVTDPLNHTTTTTYDAFGRKLSETLPLGQTQNWAYNTLGQLISATDFKGNRIDYAYNAQGRVTQKDEYEPSASSPCMTVTYTYDNPDPNNDGGHYDTVTTPDGTTTSYYDVHGQLVVLASPQGTIHYTYDPATGLESGVSTANTNTQYEYDLVGRLAAVIVNKLDGAAVGTPLVTTYAYDLNNNLLSTNLPNGTVETRTYDVDGRLSSIATTVTATGAVVFAATYTRDQDGNILVDQETRSTGTRTEAYTYDADGRLVEEEITDPVAGNRILTWAYDLAGNRVASFDSGAPTGQQSLTYSYDANDRLTKVVGSGGYEVTYTYDANGNALTLSDSQEATYTWDSEGRMVSVSVTTNGVNHAITYKYDDAGDRVSETVDGHTTTYLNDLNQAYDQVLEEYSPGGALAATYVRGLDLLFQDRAGVLSYYAVDHLGSTRSLTNSNGELTDIYDYDAYGILIDTVGTTVNGYLFTGQEYDRALGQYHLQARYYQPNTGTFTSRDTYEGSPGDPLALNHYLYGHGNPTNFVDPSGHIPVSLELGTKVHTFLGREWEKNNGSIPNVSYFGNRWISTIARRIGSPIWPSPGLLGKLVNELKRLRPDFARVDRTESTGDIYELKHLDLASMAALVSSKNATAAGAYFVSQVGLASAQLSGYGFALYRLIPSIQWRFGPTPPSEFFPDTDLAMPVPFMVRTDFRDALKPPGFELVTLAIPHLDGLLFYDFVPNKTLIEVLLATVLAGITVDAALNASVGLANTGNAATSARATSSWAVIPIGGGIAVGG